MRIALPKRLRSLAAGGVVAVMALAGAAPAGAALITSASNNPLNFAWSYATSGGAVLDGTGSLSLSGFNSTSLTVNVTLTNGASLANERLTAFGFGIDPNATAVSFVDANDGGIINAALTGPGNNFPGGLAQIEVCGLGGVNCPGGSNGGIFGGGSDTFSLILTGTWGSSVNIDPIGIRYQTDAGSFTFLTTDPGPGPGTPIPEPMSLVLLGMGLAGLGLVARRRRRDA